LQTRIEGLESRNYVARRRLREETKGGKKREMNLGRSANCRRETRQGRRKLDDLPAGGNREMSEFSRRRGKRAVRGRGKRIIGGGKKEQTLRLRAVRRPNAETVKAVRPLQ